MADENGEYEWDSERTVRDRHVKGKKGRKGGKVVTVYMNDDDLPLPTPPQPKPTDRSTDEAGSSSDLARG